VPFYFNHPRDPDAGSRSQKVRSLKDFEIHSVHKKEPTSNGQKSYQSDQHDHLHEVLRQDGLMA
jgi:hypothetical protein